LKSAINSLQTSESLDESEATSEQSIEDTKISASNVLGKRKANSGSEMSLLETLFSNSSADLNSKMLDSGASAKKIPVPINYTLLEYRI
jgi:hypothetical protein